MRCRWCGGQTDVIETRINKDGNRIRRRRECLNCGRRRTAYETWGPEDPEEPTTYSATDKPS